MRELNNKSPLVTIGIPTYKRPALLKRALTSIIDQSYTNYEIIISDNDTKESGVEKIVSEVKDLGIAVTYTKQKNTLAPYDNIFYCLDKANGDFFMWLADDDEISDREYLDNLVKILIDNPSASTAMANWVLMKDPKHGETMVMRDYQSKFWFVRVVKFAFFSRDDFFYGLHRTESLRNANRIPYFWPNKDQAINWVYTFLIDMVIQGEIIGTNKKNIRWINHNYTSKEYNKKDAESFLLRALMFALRRVNVHYLYALKIFKIKGAFYATLIIPISLLSLILESALLLQKKIKFSLRF